MVREFNFSNEANNRAAGTISAGLYERKALDCTVPLPLIVTLNNLAYLVANNRKIRELLCEDGGLERLIRILREVPKNNGSFTRPLHNKDLQPMWKWTTAFQCIVHLCIRGGVTVRERAVEAGIVPILVKVLESYLCFSDAMRAERKRVAEEKRQQRQGVETEDQRAERQQRARERERERREWERQASLIAAATANLGRRETTDTARRTPSRTVRPANGVERDPTAVPARPAPLDLAATTPQHSIQPLPSLPPASHSAPPSRSPTTSTSGRTSTTRAPMNSAASASTSAASSLQRPASASSSRIPAPLIIADSESQIGEAVAPQTPRRQAATLASSPRGMTFPVQPRAAEFTVLPDEINPTLSVPVPVAPLAAPSASAPPRPTAAAVLSNNTSHEDLAAGAWSGSEGAEEAEMSADGDDPDESEAERDSQVRGETSGARRDDAEERRTPRASRRALAPLLAAQHSIPEVRGADQLPATQEQDSGAAVGMSARSETVTPRAGVFDVSTAPSREDSHHHHHHHGRDRHATVTSRTRPILPTTYIAETFDPTDMAFREEEVLLSLQILAYLTKYSHIRALLRFPEMTRATNLHDLDVLWEKAETSSGTPLWQPGSPFHRSIYTIAERYTCRATRRDPSAEFIAGTTKLAPLIQYWAGVVMRNACRKDDRENDPHAGLRQCGNMLCGKWETQPREFAKCRRCKKAKFCSKICQSTSWQIGHKYWCSSISDDTESSRARGHRVDEDAAVPEVTNILGEAMQPRPAGQPGDEGEMNGEQRAVQGDDGQVQLQNQEVLREGPAESEDMDQAMAAPTPRQRNRGSSFARVPIARRPSVRDPSQSSSVPARIVSEAASINASDVSEDDEAEMTNSRPMQTSENDMSEHERGGPTAPLVGGFRFNAPPAPRRTDIAGRPLPPPVIAGTGMELAGRQGLDDDTIGIGDSDGHFDVRFNAAVVEDQFGRGDIDQITWRGQTPTQEVQEAHARHRAAHQPHQLFEPSNTDRSAFQGAETLEQGAEEYRNYSAPALTSQPLATSMSQQPTLHAPVPYSGRRFPSMSIESGPGSEAAHPLNEPSPSTGYSGTNLVPSSTISGRRAVSGAVPSSLTALEVSDPVARPLRGQHSGLHHHHSHGQHLNQHQHLIMRGGVAAGLMGRSATPSAYDLDSHLARGAAGSGSHRERPSSSDLPVRSVMGSASAMSSPLGGSMAHEAEEMANYLDEQATPHIERRDPIGSSSGISHQVQRHDESNAHGRPYSASYDKRRETSTTTDPHMHSRRPVEYQTSLLGNAAPSGSRTNITAPYASASASSASGRSSPDHMEMSPTMHARRVHQGDVDEQMNLD
ncbi:hypothetical protein BCV69DRAFT_310027 [Microstroma glucosiphilum]|uniref:MYND-type domain-containing protein n=1 Tax=Pseudomicrostroma glucosiphilum TaxID=1684307 RepID=A0A316UIM8_9BASI|nr:hypothetical protein BCV69DRAFT_310027 [Pseudomicrostroma glucosiphilum]PWN24191.1 hypothetical protein BCV69DRAFT_310027 [Pseudomicrostroma glucosiphilum]